MSKDKLYAVKNDEGEYWDFECAGFWRRVIPGCYTTITKKGAEIIVNEQGGHVITLIEEPEKVVLTKEQAIIVENAHFRLSPATFIYDSNEKDEELLMNAYVNGYTVAKEQKYNVKVPHTDDSYFYKVDGEYCNAGDSYHLEGMTDKKWFTESEIEHYGLQDCEKVWCDSDD